MGSVVVILKRSGCIRPRNLNAISFTAPRDQTGYIRHILRDEGPPETWGCNNREDARGATLNLVDNKDIPAQEPLCLACGVQIFDRALQKWDELAS